MPAISSTTVADGRRGVTRQPARRDVQRLEDQHLLPRPGEAGQRTGRPDVTQLRRLERPRASPSDRTSRRVRSLCPTLAKASTRPCRSATWSTGLRLARAGPTGIVRCSWCTPSTSRSGTSMLGASSGPVTVSRSSGAERARAHGEGQARTGHPRAEPLARELASQHPGRGRRAARGTRSGGSGRTGWRSMPRPRARPLGGRDLHLQWRRVERRQQVDGCGSAVGRLSTWALMASVPPGRQYGSGRCATAARSR